MKREEALIITKGNEYAADFVQAFVAKCHLMDDIEDKDMPVTDERQVATELAFLESLLINPWVRERQALLWPHLVTGFNAWLDANKWQRSEDPLKVQDADVVKGIYHELVWWVAFLCGGIQHMNEVTTKYRSYDHELIGGK